MATPLLKTKFYIPPARPEQVSRPRLLAFGLAIYLFSWDSHNSTRRGQVSLALLALLPYVLGIAL